MKTEKTIPQKASKLLVFALILFSGLLYLYYPHIQNYSATPKWIFVSTTVLILLFFGRNERIAWSKGMFVWVSFVIVYLIQSYWSYNFWDAITRTIPMILAPLAVILLYKEANDFKEFYTKISLGLAILISPILLINLAEIAGLVGTGDYSHLATYQFRFTFGNRNQYAELLTLSIPLLATGWFFVGAKEKTKRIFLLIIIFLLYLTVTLLLNRASILVLYLVYPLMFMVFLLQKVKLKTRKLAYLALFITILSGIIVIASPLRNQVPVVRNLLETRFGSGNERLVIWKNSIGLWQDSPVFGIGSGDWKIEILNTDLGFTKAEDSTVFFQRAHNDFIQIAVENGLIGLLLFVGFFIVGIYLLFKSALEKEAKIFLSAGIAGYILLSNFSFPIEKIELLIILFLFFVPSLKKRGTNTGKLNVEKLSLGLITFCILFLSVSWIKNERNYFDFKSDGDQLAFGEIDKDFYSIDPTTTPIYWHEGNTLYNQGAFEKALISYDKALKYNPNHAHVLNNTGSCYYALGGKNDAENYFKRALDINPKFVEALMNYTSFLFNKGDIDGALDQILKVPINKEPENYPMFIQAIAKAKYTWMMEIHDEPKFEDFLAKTYDNDEFLYQISRSARVNGECYEVELRNHMAKTTVK